MNISVYIISCPRTGTGQQSTWPSGDGDGDQFRWAKSVAGSNPAVDSKTLLIVNHHH